MKLLRPYYYDELKCIGNKCINHCCKGWEISIDDATYNYYQSLETSFGKQLKQNIITDGMVHHFKLSGDKVCPCLNEERLCNIYIELGEDKMCSVCKTYPRRTAVRANIIEQTLLLSCPEVARLLIEQEEKIDFIFQDDVNNPLKEISVDDMLFNILSESRSCSIDIMQMRIFSIWERQLLLLLFTNKIQECIEKSDYSKAESVVTEFSDCKILSLYVVEFEKLRTQKQSPDKFINDFISNLMVINLNRNTYMKEIFERQILNADQMTLYDLLIKYKEEFNSYMEGKTVMYENFYVHMLFTHYMSALTNKNVIKKVMLANIGYLIIRTYQLISWVDSGKQLSTANSQMIFSDFSVLFEHNKDGYNEIFKQLKEQNLISLAYQAFILS